MSDYPAWICSPCGALRGRREPRWATWHDGACGWCGEHRAVTEPRDFGYPPALASSGERPVSLPLPDPDSADVSPPAPSAPEGRPVETSARGRQPETQAP